MIYFTSDIHFFHDNIIRYCDRPFCDSAEMNEAIVSKINSVVNPDDELIFVGDVSAGLQGRKAELAELVGRINGSKRLIRGNHDHLENREYLAMGFRSVHDWLELDGLFVVHYPMVTDPNDPRKIPMQQNAMRRYRRLKGVRLVIHGHVHRKGPEFLGHFNVAGDRHDFRPLSLDEIAQRTGI